jgi:hypothetical protein
MTRVGPQRRKKKNTYIYILHLVCYFCSCITMHGFMNVKSTAHLAMPVEFTFVVVTERLVYTSLYQLTEISLHTYGK